MNELITKKFEIIIVGTFAYGMDKLIGKTVDNKFVEDVIILRDKLKINPAGEGGEFESFILNAPYFSRPLKIINSKIVKDDSGGIVLDILQME